MEVNPVAGTTFSQQKGTTESETVVMSTSDEKPKVSIVPQRLPSASILPPNKENPMKSLPSSLFSSSSSSTTTTTTTSSSSSTKVSSSIVNNTDAKKSTDQNEKVEKHTIHPLLSPSKSTKLVLGSRVIILGTDNVEQRVPQYVGVEAEIVAVPVHPATWFKVKFDSGKVVTFRPSALRLVSEGTTVDPNYTPPPKKPKSANRPRSNSLKSSDKTSSSSTSPYGNKRLLTALHQDLWPSCKVRILSGRMTGHIVTVIGSGNGWVQLESSYGEFAKRANELELLSRAKSSLVPNTPVAQVPPPSSSGPPSITVSKPVLQRRRSNSEPGSPTEISNRRNEFSAKNHFRKERKEMELQREYVQKYINKQQAKIGSRPDLKYWLSRIQGTTVDPNFERNVSRDVRSHFCHSCYMEMWSGSKFCWNELCPMSPVYWKLPGSAGTPPMDRYRQAASTSSNKSGGLDVEATVDDSEYACEVLLSLRTDIRMPQTSSIGSERSSVTFAPMKTSPRDKFKLSGSKRKSIDLKSKRSDSSTTDTEDLNDLNDEAFKHQNLNVQIRLSPPRNSIHAASTTSPRKLCSSRPNSNSPRVNFKRIRVDASSPFPAAKGLPPTPEEYAKMVLKHEQQQIASNASNSSCVQSGPLPGLNSTQMQSKIVPFSSLTASPLLSNNLNPDYPTNKSVVANMLEDGHGNSVGH